MGSSAGPLVETAGLTGIADRSVGVGVGSTEDLLIRLLLLSCVVVVLYKTVLPAGSEESLEFDYYGGCLRLTDFGLQSAVCLLVEERAFRGEALIDYDMVEGLFEVLPAKGTVGLTERLII